MTSSYTRPHPEALYYYIAVEGLAAAMATPDRWQRAQAIARTLVFSALCLEAYANQRLEDLGFGDCESLSLEKKWRNLPRFAGVQARFDESRMPFQGFQELVRLRNRRLVHFHPDEEILRGPNRLSRTYHSDLFQDVGLAERAVASMTDMIKEYRRMAQPREPAPDFLAGAKYTSFVVAQVSIPMESLGSVISSEPHKQEEEPS